MVLSAGELFNESKLVRGCGNSSVTSLSTPSFRLRPEAEMKGPCLMGLALPREFYAIFMVESPNSNLNVHNFDKDGEDASSSSGRRLLLDDDESIPSLDNITAAHSFDFHTVQNCLGCMKLKSEESNETDATNASSTNLATEMEELSPSRNKVLEVIAECSEHPERGSPGDAPAMLTPVRPGAAPGVSGQSPYMPASGEADEPNKESTPASEMDKPDQQTLLRKEVLKHVSNMICGVGSKNNEQNLLRYFDSLHNMWSSSNAYMT